MALQRTHPDARGIQPRPRRPYVGRAIGGCSVVLLAGALQACSGTGPTDPNGSPGPGGGPAPGDTLPSASDTTIISVSASGAGQRVDGFGAFAHTLVYGGTDYLGAMRPQAIKTVFDDVGLSLAFLLVEPVEAPASAPDPWSALQNDNSDPFVLNGAGFNFTAVETTRAKLLLPARSYGFGDLTLGPVLNLRGPLSFLVPIRNQDYTRYLNEAAEHVLALVQHWRDAYGETPARLELFNEPTSGNAELASTSTQEVVDLVRVVGQRLRSAGFNNLTFVVPNEESPSRSLEVARAILQDPAARPFVGAIGYHPYPYASAYGSPRRIMESTGAGSPNPGAVAELQALAALGAQYGVPVWLTETSEEPGNSDYAFDAVENVLARASHIHDNFRYAGASAYFGMNALWDSRSHADHFSGRNVPFLSQSSHMALVDLNAGKVLITGMGYAVGHYARWVKPGARVVPVQSDNQRVLATAFRDDARNRIVVVAVNHTTQDRLLRIRLTGAEISGSTSGESSWGTTRWGAVGPYQAASVTEVQVPARARSVLSVAIPTR